jgi:hypothetical protein
MKLEFLRQILGKYVSNFMKILPEGAELFHVDGGTDRLKADSIVKVLIDTVSLAGCIAASVDEIKYKTPQNRMGST